MLRQPDLMYQTPSGEMDEHFVYVFNADNLVDGADYRYLTQQLDGGSDFILRKVGGLNDVLGLSAITNRLGSWMLRDQLQRDVFSAPVIAGSQQFGPFTTNLADFPILPEIRYPESGTISFDLLSVLKGTVLWGCGAITIPLSEVLFWGVKRRKGVDRCSSYKYKLRPFSYSVPILVDWDVYVYNAMGIILGNTSPHRFSIPVDGNKDFELWGIHNSRGYAPVLMSPYPWCKIMLYDQGGKARSSGPMLIEHYGYQDLPFNNFLIYNFGVRSVGNAVAPPILYEAGSTIQFDIHSMVPRWLNPVPIPTPNPDFPFQGELTFFGAQRIPV